MLSQHHELEVDLSDIAYWKPCRNRNIRFSLRFKLVVSRRESLRPSDFQPSSRDLFRLRLLSASGPELFAWRSKSPSCLPCAVSKNPVSQVTLRAEQSLPALVWSSAQSLPLYPYRHSRRTKRRETRRSACCVSCTGYLCSEMRYPLCNVTQYYG